MRRRVVVTGMGAITPLGLNTPTSWKALISGKSGITKLSQDYDSLPCKIGGLIKDQGSPLNLTNYFTKTELKTMSPATAYALLAAKEAVEDAKLTEATPEIKNRTGVAVGMGMVDLEDITKTNEALRKSYKQVSPFFVPRILPNMAAGHISIKYGLRGPNHAVSTACATGAHAIGDSLRFIRNGDCEVMVCGATEASISPLAIAGFCRLRALSTSYNDNPEKASRPFDEGREGFVMGEGSAILVLEELEHALKRGVAIYAEILGYGLSGDAHHLTAPSSDGLGAILAMKGAVNDAGVHLKDVGYINAHATSTPVGDAIEVRAIKGLFGDHVTKLAVSSTKSAHGHLLGAAGNLETVFTVKAVEVGELPPTINLEKVDFGFVNFVPFVSQKWESDRRIALKNAFGFGGTNACLCIAQFDNTK